MLAGASYGPYGEPDSTTGARFRYTGQILIPELGLYHYKARTYSPWLGRFLQTDPIGYADGMNLYAYVGNDPTNATDPSGLEKFAPCAGDQGFNGMCADSKAVSVTFGETIVVTADCSKGWSCIRDALAIERFLASGPDVIGRDTFKDGDGGKDGDTSESEEVIVVTGEKKERQNSEQSTEDKYACFMAIGGGALDGVVDPQALIGDVLTAGAWGATRAGTIARAALPIGRALNLAKASLPGLALSVVVQATAGGAYAYFTDPRCQ